MLSCEQKQNVIDGKKRIILNPSESQKKDFEAVTFAENEVWGIDVLVSTGDDGKVRIIAHYLRFTQAFNLGKVGRVENFHLPKRFDCFIPVEDEDFSCSFF